MSDKTGRQVIKKEQPNEVQSVDGHGTNSDLLYLQRMLGFETPVLSLIVHELNKPQDKRNNKHLKALVEIVKNALKQKGLEGLLSVGDEPRSFADLVLGEYDPAARVLPERFLPDLFKLFHPGKTEPLAKDRIGKKRGPEPIYSITIKFNKYLDEHPEYNFKEELKKCIESKDRLLVRAVADDLHERMYPGEGTSPIRIKKLNDLVRGRIKGLSSKSKLH